MSDPLGHFVRTCRQINPVAAAAEYPPFTAAFRQETPLNSGPYIFDIDDFRDTFGTNARRLRIIAEAEAALDALRCEGVLWHLLLVGGSFIREGDAPSDLDGLVVYSMASDDPSDVDRTICALRAIMTMHPFVDFKFCPVDTHPVILVKRLLFFANVFGYDKQTRHLSRGSVMVLPRLGCGMADGHCE